MNLMTWVRRLVRRGSPDIAPLSDPRSEPWPANFNALPQAEQQAVRLQRSRARSAYDRQRAINLGITHYRWTWSRAGDSCDRCKALDGKRFAWTKPPPGGHPGECACGPYGNCRCVAWSEIKGFE
jgi:hypothetical protein